MQIPAWMFIAALSEIAKKCKQHNVYPADEC
jgi:hypothetical protein